MKTLKEEKPPSRIKVEQTPIWRNTFLLILYHIPGAYGFASLLCDNKPHWQTVAFAFFMGYIGGIGTTAGSHRLWAHQSYKAKTPLKIFLIFAQACTGQDNIFTWVRDHRVHHKYTETDADPYNAKRGFWFSHIGWLVTKRHENVLAKLRTIDVSDLEADPIVMFQYKYYYYIAFFMMYVIPLYVPCAFWGETLYFAFLAANAQHATALHITFLVNSAAHMWGVKPFDKNIGPVENKIVSFFACGEGWHNYHHVFPWDYKAAELGNYRMNLTTALIDFFALIGWAYDLKVVSKSMVGKRAGRTGDGSWQLLNNNNNNSTSNSEDSHHGDHHIHQENLPWGWGDKDISKEAVESTMTLHWEKKRLTL